MSSDHEQTGLLLSGEGAFQADAVVVGAGLSGLVAACRLADKGASVVVLEARERVGGRLWSAPHGEAVFDYGGQWMGPRQHRLRALADTLEVPSFETWREGRKTLELGGRVQRTDGDVLSALGWTDRLRAKLGLQKLGKLTGTIPLDRPWEHPDAAALDRVTVAGWAARAGWTPPLRAGFGAVVRSLLGAEPEELSLLHFLFFLIAGVGLSSLSAIADGARERRFVGGSQQLAELLAERLPGRVVTGAPVRRIAHGVESVSVTTDAGTVHGRFCVLAVPPRLAGIIQYEPRLPTPREHLTQRLPMGHMVGALLMYERAFWRDRGLSGEALCDAGPATFWVDNTDAQETVPCLRALCAGRSGRVWASLPAATRRQALLDQAARCFGPEALAPSAVVVSDWSRERWTGGAPTSVVAPGILTQLGAALRTPVGALHFAGTETAMDGNGYMEGAVEAGERAADEVLARL